MATDDKRSGSTSKSYHDSGDRDQTATGTTDSGTDKSIEHDTGLQTNKTTTTVSGFGSVETDSSGDTTDYSYTGSYDMSGGSETDDGTFRQEDQPSATSSYTASYTAPSDPGTTWTSMYSGSTNSDNVDHGPIDETDGTVTSETDNFTDSTSTSDTGTYNASSDQGAPLGVVVDSPPGAMLYVTMGPGMRYQPPYPGNDSAAPTMTSSTFSQSATATASSSGDDSATATASGTTTDTSGSVSTSETFHNNDHSDYSDNTWQSITGSYSAYGTTYDWSTVNSAADGGSANYHNDGGIVGGVTSDSYSNTASQSATASSSTSWDTTTSAADGHGINTTSASGSTTGTTRFDPRMAGRRWYPQRSMLYSVLTEDEEKAWVNKLGAANWNSVVTKPAVDRQVLAIRAEHAK